VERPDVRVAVDGDGLDAQLAAGAHDAHRDLAAVGDEQALKRLVDCLGHCVFAQRH
jgi:hypothetical protein